MTEQPNTLDDYADYAQEPALIQITDIGGIRCMVIITQCSHMVITTSKSHFNEIKTKGRKEEKIESFKKRIRSLIRKPRSKK